MLLGILTGGSVFGITTFSGRPLPSAMRWAASGFAFISLAMHYQCNAQLKNEQDRMQFIVDQLNQSSAGKRNLSTGHNAPLPPTPPSQ